MGEELKMGEGDMGRGNMEIQERNMGKWNLVIRGWID